MTSFTKADAGTFAEIGETGLTQQAGIVRTEWLPALQGDKAAKVYREMIDNDQIVGAALHAIEMYLRRVEWTTVPADDSPQAAEMADFADGCRDDMSHSWADFIGEMLTMLPFGHAFHEVCYKQSQGTIPDRPGLSSKYDDGLIRWRKLPLRAQDSREKWLFDDEGGVAGMVQRRPSNNDSVPIPIQKALLFRTTNKLGNPEGRSILRTAYRAYHFKKRTEEYEGVGLERDLAGIPLIGVPEELLDPNAPPELQASLAVFTEMAKNLRNDEQAGVVYPLAYDRAGNQRYKIELLSSQGRKGFDTGAIVERWSRYEAMSVLADVIVLGHERVGSEALARTKSEMFTLTLDAWLRDAAGVLNQHAIPRLFALNGFDLRLCPTYVPNAVTEVDLAELIAMIGELAGRGAAFFPNPELETWLAGRAGVPAELLNPERDPANAG